MELKTLKKINDLFNLCPRDGSGYDGVCLHYVDQNKFSATVTNSAALVRLYFNDEDVIELLSEIKYFYIAYSKSDHIIALMKELTKDKEKEFQVSRLVEYGAETSYPFIDDYMLKIENESQSHVSINFKHLENLYKALRPLAKKEQTSVTISMKDEISPIMLKNCRGEKGVLFPLEVKQ